MIAPEWLWIPITLGAALAQTLRNAAQRHLTPVLGTLGATLVRFLYGLPFALLWYAAVAWGLDHPAPSPRPDFLLWVLVSSVSQIAATALLLRVMAERNFAIGIAYARTDVIQIAVFGFAILGDPLTATALLAVILGTLGVMLLSPVDRQRPLRTLMAGWGTRAALLGILSGAGFGIASVGYRGASLALGDTPFLLAAAYTLVAAQAMQTVLLGGALAIRDAPVIGKVLREWRKSLVAGLMGAVASAGWFTALILEPAVHVRTLGLVEIFFGYAISRHFFREPVSRLELAGMALLAGGLAVAAQL